MFPLQTVLHIGTPERGHCIACGLLLNTLESVYDSILSW